MTNKNTIHARELQRSEILSLTEKASNRPVRTLLVDDHAVFLKTVREFLVRHPQIEIVGCAQNGVEAIRVASEALPDLILMDLAMPEMGGIEATRHIKALLGSAKVIMLTLYDVNLYRVEAQLAGADAFLTKGEFFDSLPALIEKIFGDSSFDSSFYKRSEKFAAKP